MLAGPGAGKTFCLIERIRFLVETKKFDPSRIYAFTFTNKAAEEIAHRLEKYLGPNADHVRRGTIHAFCAEVLRKYPEDAGLEPGFGIADEDYQLEVLRRIEGPKRWHRNTLTCFTAHRFLSDSLRENDRFVYEAYCDFLIRRNLVDFDQLVLKAADLFRNERIAEEVRQRWDCILVDEFQDLNRVQYSIVRSLAKTHRNIFGVGDDEQSIYSWAGANPEVFVHFSNDFGITWKAQLGENRRCPQNVVSTARRLLTANTPLFTDRRHAESDRESAFPITAMSFPTDLGEMAWIIKDIRSQRAEYDLDWGDFAVLYRKHEIGNVAEAAFLAARIPCQLAHGRALSEDPVVRYLIAALRVIAFPDDPIFQERFLEVVFPRPLFLASRAQADKTGQTLIGYLESWARGMPKAHGDRRKVWRGLYALKNLTALALSHASIGSLVDELLSQRVGEYKTVLEVNHDEISDPLENPEVDLLAQRLTEAIEFSRTVWIPRIDGIEIALKGMLLGTDINRVQLGGIPPEGAVRIEPGDCKSIGLAVGLFKALQIVRSRDFANIFRDYTAVDLETTDNDIDHSEIVEIAAVRVRDGKIVDTFHRMVRPRVPITAGARETHGIAAEQLVDEPYFESVWPEFRNFLGADIVVAHNGYMFDFPILRRMAAGIAGADFHTYDTLVLARELHASSGKLPDLARLYGIETGKSHRALDDTVTLARLFVSLGDTKVIRARKTSLDNLLDYLGIALALSDRSTLDSEADRLRDLSRFFSLGKHTACLDFYRDEFEKTDDASVATPETVIDLLGGETLRLRLLTDKTAEERYPGAMQRLRPLLPMHLEESLSVQITAFLERVVLSRRESDEPATARANLLTLHSTKGLEFSRVYIAGAEDAQLPGEKQDLSKREIEEARRLLYVGMTRTKERLVLTRVDERAGRPTGGHRFLNEMELVPVPPT